VAPSIKETNSASKAGSAKHSAATCGRAVRRTARDIKKDGMVVAEVEREGEPCVFRKIRLVQ
jgi:hypothetical protein